MFRDDLGDSCGAGDRHPPSAGAARTPAGRCAAAARGRSRGSPDPTHPRRRTADGRVPPGGESSTVPAEAAAWINCTRAPSSGCRTNSWTGTSTPSSSRTRRRRLMTCRMSHPDRRSRRRHRRCPRSAPRTRFGRFALDSRRRVGPRSAPRSRKSRWELGGERRVGRSVEAPRPICDRGRGIPGCAAPRALATGRPFTASAPRARTACRCGSPAARRPATMASGTCAADAARRAPPDAPGERAVQAPPPSRSTTSSTAASRRLGRVALLHRHRLARSRGSLQDAVDLRRARCGCRRR